MRKLTTLSIILSTISLSACGGGALLIEGSVAGEGLEESLTAFWGGRYIIFADAALDCIDLAWVHHSYSDAAPPTELSLNILQLTFSRGDDVFEGNFSVEGQAEVNGRFMITGPDGYEEYRARSGFLNISEAGGQGDVSGTFDLEFEEGNLNGEFSVEWCVNLPD
jgi:hypothetical protein